MERVKVTMQRPRTPPPAVRVVLDDKTVADIAAHRKPPAREPDKERTR